MSIDDYDNFEGLKVRLEGFIRETDNRLCKLEDNYTHQLELLGNIKTSIEIMRLTVDNTNKTVQGLDEKLAKELSSFRNKFETSLKELEYRVDKIEEEPVNTLKSRKNLIVNTIITVVTSGIVTALLALTIANN